VTVHDFRVYIDLITTGETSEQCQYDVLKCNINDERDQRAQEAKSCRSSLICRASRERMPDSQADTTAATSNQIAS
jgi:hypothetical protein